MYIALYNGWIAATPVPNREYYEDRGNLFFYLSLGIVALGIVAFSLLRKKHKSNGSRPESTAG